MLNAFLSFIKHFSYLELIVIIVLSLMIVGSGILAFKNKKISLDKQDLFNEFFKNMTTIFIIPILAKGSFDNTPMALFIFCMIVICLIDVLRFI